MTSLELGIESNSMLGSCDGGASCAYTNTVAWRTPTTPLPIENNPRAVFERLFGASGTTDPEARQARMRRDRSLLDAVNGELKHLGLSLGAGDQVKLDEYLEAVRDAERRIQLAERQSATELPVVDRPIGTPSDYAEHAKLLMDLLALAYQTDMTRISTFMLAREVSSRAYPEIGVSDSHHPLSHHQDRPINLQRLGVLNEYHFQQFAHLVKRLAETPEGDGTMLDSTLFLYGTGNQRQQHPFPRGSADCPDRRQVDRGHRRALRALSGRHAAGEPAHDRPGDAGDACRELRGQHRPTQAPVRLGPVTCTPRSGHRESARGRRSRSPRAPAP